ncbi:PREDICTED: uncharacterized protein LOC104805055 isoform X2 [Tarenaya hassleriana]|uniref:uncharacterized protein LOC104805055 isoform X2 n=1 Tax=Tarenaya hassleriana TaxID=28532 RepID=UPI0008FD15B9|nr:PREDICTED: uncharacterized protein LOC104805055 isoform X2 [Tarenaya hassleriana]
MIGESVVLQAPLSYHLKVFFVGSFFFKMEFGENQVLHYLLLQHQPVGEVSVKRSDLASREFSRGRPAPQLIYFQELLSSMVKYFQKLLDLIVKYGWDFDHYLEEDVSAGCSEDKNLAAVVTPTSSVDYTTSNSRINLLLPLGLRQRQEERKRSSKW